MTKNTNPFELNKTKKKSIKNYKKHPRLGSIPPMIFNIGVDVFNEGTKQPKKKK